MADENVQAVEPVESEKVEAPEALPEKLEAKKEEKVSTKKKYKIKVDKNEEELEFDPNNDEEVTKYLQKARAADKRFQEANDVRKAAMEFIDELRKNPKSVLTNPNIGIDVRKFAEEILNEQIAEMEKTPEQKEREKLQKELSDLKAKDKDREDAFKKSEQARVEAEYGKQLESDIMSALDIGGIPKTARMVATMAQYMEIALRNNIELSAKDIAPLVKNTTLSEFKEIVQSLSDDQLEDFIGKEVLGRLRKKNVAKAKAVETASAVKPTGNSVKKDNKEEPKKQTIKQFFGI